MFCNWWKVKLQNNVGKIGYYLPLFGTQVSVHWQDKVPEELSGFALVPVVGGLASQGHCSARTQVRERDARCVFRWSETAAVMRCLAGAGCLCAASSAADTLLLERSFRGRCCPPASCERIMAALRAVPQHQLLAALEHGSAVAVSSSSRGERLSASSHAQSGSIQLREILARASSGSAAVPSTFLRGLPRFQTVGGALVTAAGASAAPTLLWERQARYILADDISRRTFVGVSFFWDGCPKIATAAVCPLCCKRAG